MFSPHNILQEMDMKGGVLNYTGIELLRNVETKGIKFSSTMLPSRITLQRHARKVELIANDLCPVQCYEDGNEFGEGFRFYFEKTTKLLLKTHDLIGTAATRKVELSSSIDGATLTKSLGFVAAGVKLIDIACKHPITKEFVDVPAAYGTLPAAGGCAPHPAPQWPQPFFFPPHPLPPSPLPPPRPLSPCCWLTGCW